MGNGLGDHCKVKTLDPRECTVARETIDISIGLVLFLQFWEDKVFQGGVFSSVDDWQARSINS